MECVADRVAGAGTLNRNLVPEDVDTSRCVRCPKTKDKVFHPLHRPFLDHSLSLARSLTISLTIHLFLSPSLPPLDIAAGPKALSPPSR